MRIFLLCAVALVISGCASTRLNEGLPYFLGQNVDYAISYLGYPQSQQQINDKTVYTWGHNRSFTTHQTVYTPVYGNIGGTYYSGQTASVVPQTHNYYCMIRLVANQSKVIEYWEWDGNEGGCSGYADAVSNMMDANGVR